MALFPYLELAPVAGTSFMRLCSGTDVHPVDTMLMPVISLRFAVDGSIGWLDMIKAMDERAHLALAERHRSPIMAELHHTSSRR